MVPLNPKILLTTVYRGSKDGYYDYFETNARTRFRPSNLRKISYGLRFLKQNLPELEILEYPTWPEYLKKIREGWDIVGFSFYLNEICEILEMADAARGVGIKELWAGNYGALTPEVEPYFDRVFIGYAEDQIAQVLGRRVESLRHPPLVLCIRLGPIGLKYMRFGVVFTSRGCPMRCKFCQTPSFCPKPFRIPLESVEEVLRYYRRMGLNQLMILDENFGAIRDHTERVTELLARYKFYWWVMVRADQVVKNLPEWVKCGFASGFIGVESFSQATLNKVDKRETVEVIEDSVRRMHEHNCYAGGYYIIGFEDETVESIRADMRWLMDLKLDYTQLCVITPLPRTQLWDEISTRYGIVEQDWHRFDMKSLVWRHPRITPSQMESLLIEGFRRLNPPERYFKSIERLSRRYLAGDGRLKGWYRLLLENPISAIGFDDRDLGHTRFL